MEIKSKYACSQSALYQICLLIALNCKSKIADFGLFSAAYTLTFVDAIIAAIQQAEQMPGEEARAEQHKLLQEQLKRINKDSLKSWQYLKRYIAKLYPDSPEMQETAWIAAGWNHYDSNNDWKETKACLKMGSEYIKNHKTELLANDNMPATFEAMYNVQMTLFTDTYTDFGLAIEAAEVGTDDKLTANNDIYDRIITVCLDGQVIFEGNDTLQGQFSFENVGKNVAPPAGSAVKFHVINPVTGLPIMGAEISKKGSDKKVSTNAKGDAEMNQLASVETEFIFKADGFSDKTVSVDLTGTTKSVEVSMEPLFQGEMNVGASPEAGVESPEPAVGSPQ
jgi:hypothetical protein